VRKIEIKNENIENPKYLNFNIQQIAYQNFMKSKTLIRNLLIITAIAIVATISVYYLNFSDQVISKSSSDWGTFGDFIGGILNPVFAFLNLLVLAYLTLKITEDDNNRNLFAVYEAAKPLGEFNTVGEESKLRISYHNCGFGPLKISNISIKFEDKEYSSFIPLFSDVKNIYGAHWQFSEIIGSEAIVAKDSHFLLLNFYFDSKTPEVITYMKYVYETIAAISVTIYYVDIYDRKMPPTFVRFGRLDI
jgi:hypothetical protein